MFLDGQSLYPLLIRLQCLNIKYKKYVKYLNCIKISKLDLSYMKGNIKILYMTKNIKNIFHQTISAHMHHIFLLTYTHLHVILETMESYQKEAIP